MKEIKQLAKRLSCLDNLSEFARKYKLQYRTLTRIKSHAELNYTPSYRTVLNVTKALDKELLPKD